MLRKFLDSSDTFKTFVLTNVVTLVIFLALIPLLFNEYKDIPLGILLGGFSTSIPYLLFYLGERGNKKRLTLTIFTIIFTACWHAVILIVAFLLYFTWNLRIFNVYAVFGSLFISLIIYVIINLITGKREHRG